ncbi:MAG TPA: hypothetical protein VIN60_08965 [Anaerolineales bacterium]
MIAIIYAILIAPMIALAIIGPRTVNERCVWAITRLHFFTALVMWALNRRKQYIVARAVALIPPVIVLIVSFFFGYL